MCVLLFCVCMSDCVSKFVCARVFALMSVYVRLNVFECVPARHVPMCFLCIGVSACDSRVFVHIYVGDVDVGGHSYVCDCFLVCCLCVSLRVYMCTHVCNIYVFCLCVCVSVYTHVCGAHAGDIPPQMRETRVPMLEAPLPLFLYCLPATCATCNSPNTNTNKHIHYAHM